MAADAGEKLCAAGKAARLSGRETASRSDPAVVHLTHQELANMIGICRQTATLFLGRFRDEGILDTGKGYIKLYDMNRLRTLAAEEK